MAFSFTAVRAKVCLKLGKIKWETKMFHATLDPLFFIFKRDVQLNSPPHCALCQNHSAVCGDAHFQLEQATTYMSSRAYGIVSCVTVTSHETTRHMSSVTKMQTPTSHTGYAFGRSHT